MELKALRTSPAGVVHRELLLEHRSLQTLAGLEREVRALVTVKVTGRALAAAVASLEPGSRVLVTGLLGQASHRSPQQLLIHAQTIERHE